MARNKEAAVVLLDVGPEMGHALQPAIRAVASFIHSKIVNKPTHEVELVYFGTTETRNDLNAEMADEGDDSQYTNMVVERRLEPPDIGWLQSLANVEQGASGVPADFFDAVTLAADSLCRSMDARPEVRKASKRIILVSNLLGEAKPVDDDFMESIVGKLQESDIRLDVMTIDIAEADAAASETKNGNTDTLGRLLQGVRHTQRSVEDLSELPTVFKLKEVSSVAYYTGPLAFGDTMKLKVKVTKKVSAERPPSCGKYSEVAQGEGASHGVERSVEHRLVTNPDVVVPEEERVKAYQYGSQLVPMPKELESYLKFKAPKSLKLMGFIGTPEKREEETQIMRHHYMKDAWVVVPDKADERSCLAMSALIKAMLRDKQRAVLRFVAREDTQVHHCVGIPLLASGERAACLVMNHLPFQEDVRSYPFRSFDVNRGQKHVPSREQWKGARELVDSLDLCADGKEQLRPEQTANPLLHRFYATMAAKALQGDDTPLPDAGPTAARLGGPPLDHLSPAAQDQLSTLQDLFPIAAVKTEAAGGASQQGPLGAGDGASADFFAGGEAGTAVEGVGTATPTEDFRALIAAEQEDLAFEELPVAIVHIVRHSLGERSYGKAVAALNELREAATKARSRAPGFNAFLRQLADQFEADPTHAAFWARVMAEQITLLSEQEAPGSGATAADAAQFIKDHTPSAKESEEAMPEAAADEDDEFAEMD